MVKLIETSLQTALQAHVEQTDKAEKAYVLHPFRIMAKMDTTFSRSVFIASSIKVSNLSPSELAGQLFW